MEEIASWVGSESGYEWAEVHVYRRTLAGFSFQAYAVEYQSGCSCTSYEEPDINGLDWTFSLGVLYTRLRDSLDPHWFNDAQRAEIQAEIRRRTHLLSFGDGREP